MEKKTKNLSSIENSNDMIPEVEYRDTEEDLMRLGIYTGQPISKITLDLWKPINIKGYFYKKAKKMWGKIVKK